MTDKDDYVSKAFLEARESALRQIEGSRRGQIAKTFRPKPLVIYHKNCMDGFTALWAAQLALGDVEAWGASWGQKPPSDVTGREVYIVDFSYPRDDLLRLNEQAASLLVLDHHESGRKQLEGLDFCVFDMSRSGAGLSWDHFHPGEDRPWLVDYVEDQDLWTWNLPNAKAICSYLNLQEKTIERWDELAEMNKDDAIKSGEMVVASMQDYVKATTSLAREMLLLGHWIPVVNAPFWCASDLGNHLSMKPMENGSHPPFAAIWHQKRDGTYKFSLRSSENPHTGTAFDVTSVCEHFGGGGHSKAGGFNTSKLPFE